MRLHTLLLLASTIPSATGAFAQDYNRADIVRGLCEKDGCSEFAILDKQPVATGPDGELFRTRIQTFHASAQGRTTEPEQSGYAYCSRTRPAVISAPEGKPPVAVFLAPEEQSPAWVQRSTTNFYAIYFAVCHGVEAGRNAARDRQDVARSLGYHVDLSQPKTETLNRVEDILHP